MSENNLLAQIEQINVLLRAFGPAAVHQIKMMKNGNVVGQIRYGYRPQYIFDAVNYVIRPENWRYEIVSKEIFEYQAVVEVKLFIKAGNEWLCKGSHTGQMSIVKKNVGDAYKGAATDALQKCFSVLSIGCDAYRGLLQGVYEGRQNANSFRTYPKRVEDGCPQLPNKTQRQLPANPPPQKLNNKAQQKPPTPELPSPDPSSNQIPPGLPEFPGCDWDVIDGKVIAIGDTWKHKEKIKSCGFRWDGKEKHWYRELSELAA